MAKRNIYADNLAAAFLAGVWTKTALLRRATEATGLEPRSLRRLVGKVLELFPASMPTPDPDVLARALAHASDEDSLRRIYWLTPRMTQAPWSVPQLATTGALAEWLGITHGELDWFADCQSREERTPAGPLRHYTYNWLKGRRGKRRLLEMPKHRLKEIQRRVLHDILDRLPPHNAAHGFRQGRSVRTFAAPHANRTIVLRFDLRAFFPSIPASRVHALFRTAGYPRDVARVLTGLCTNRVPNDVWNALLPEDRARAEYATERRLYRAVHLPQGTPTSPALANLCAYRFDCRLHALALSLNADYTRYADDLAFSGGEELERGARRFQVLVGRIALEEGFELHTRKSRFMRQGVRQQLAGVVVNAHPNVRRDEFDRLKAILTNCVRHGPASQNRDGHANFRGCLAGKIAYVSMLNPARGERLRILFEGIKWENL